MFTLRDALCGLRGNYILSLPRSKTTTYGLHSFSYLAAKLWNSLPDIYRTSASLVCVCMCVYVCMILHKYYVHTTLRTLATLDKIHL